MAAATTVRNLALNSLPALMIVTKVRSTPEVLTVIPGNFLFNAYYYNYEEKICFFLYLSISIYTYVLGALPPGSLVCNS